MVLVVPYCDKLSKLRFSVLNDLGWNVRRSALKTRVVLRMCRENWILFHSLVFDGLCHSSSISAHKFIGKVNATEWAGILQEKMSNWLSSLNHYWFQEVNFVFTFQCCMQATTINYYLKKIPLVDIWVFHVEISEGMVPQGDKHT